MKANFFKNGLPALAVLIAILFIAGSELIAQNFQNNNAGVYTAGPNGKIRMRAPAGQFTTTTATDLGRDAANRIEGTVEWTNANPQQIQANRYYENLTTAGAGTKTYQGNAYVSLQYLPSGGDRDYSTFTFYYDGTDQTIFPEGSTSGNLNRYNNLYLDGTGNKTIVAVAGNGGEVNVRRDFTSTANAVLLAYDNMTVGQDAGTGSTVAGAVTIGNGVEAAVYTQNVNNIAYSAPVTIANLGDFILNEAGDATFAGNVAVGAGGGIASTDNVAGVFDFNGTLALADATSTLSLGLATQMTVSSVFTNGDPARTNMTFEDGSFVIYDGPANQSIMSTAQANSYANLTIEGGAKVPNSGAGAPNIYMRGNFIMGNAGLTTLDMATSDVIFAMTNGTATYGANLSEVRGKFRRSGLTAAQDYNFNNLRTVFNFSTVAGDWFQLDVRPSTAPSIQAPTAPTVDVQRKFTLASSNGAGSFGEVAAMRLAYLGGEYGGTNEGRIRLLEGDGGNRDEKIVTGVPIPLATGAGTQREIAGSGAGGWSSIQLTGSVAADYLVMRNDNARGSYSEVGQGHDVVLTDQRGYLISIVNGRWSANGTWDEGRPPMHDEDALVRHIVYTGMDNGPFGSAAEIRDEDDPQIDPTFNQADNFELLSNNTTIAPPNTNIGGLPPGGANSVLVINNTDNTLDANMIYIFGATGGPNHGLYNNNTTVGTVWDEVGATTNLQGIHVYTDPVGRTANMRVSQLTNEGRVTNNGTIEIGD